MFPIPLAGEVALWLKDANFSNSFLPRLHTRFHCVGVCMYRPFLASKPDMTSDLPNQMRTGD